MMDKPMPSQTTESKPASSANSVQRRNPSHEAVTPIIRIEEKIQQLKKKKEKIQIQQALLFMKEAQKIFKEDFSPEMALLVLSETWTSATETQRQEWKKRGHSFRLLPFHSTGKKA